MHLLPPFLPIRWWVALCTVQKFGLEKHLWYYGNMKIREACRNMVRLRSSTVQAVDLIIFISLFLNLKITLENTMWEWSCQLSSSLCFKLNWEHQKSKLQNGSQYTLSFLPARSPSSFSMKDFRDWFIHICSLTCSPRESCSHNSCPVNLMHHTSCDDIR